MKNLDIDPNDPGLRYIKWMTALIAVSSVIALLKLKHMLVQSPDAWIVPCAIVALVIGGMFRQETIRSIWKSQIPRKRNALIIVWIFITTLLLSVPFLPGGDSAIQVKIGIPILFLLIVATRITCGPKVGPASNKNDQNLG